MLAWIEKQWVDRLKVYGSRLKPYERHLSALGMVGGFVFDSFAYGQVDHGMTQIVLLVYLTAAATSIAFLHYLESRPERRGPTATRLRGLLPTVTQFAFGTLWSAFLVFYARSGVLVSSWPFFGVLLAIFVGNEIFRTYHARLIFTVVLFAFALLSYAIFMVPVFTHTIGLWTFLLSGLAAGAVFVGFLKLLSVLAHERFGESRWPIRFGAGAVFAAVYGLYFVGVLPPLPLAMQTAGVYTSIRHVGPLYYVSNEKQSWKTFFGADPVVHLAKGEKVYVFGAVFAPIKLSTTIHHVWQRYDTERRKWQTVQTVSYAINGGRDDGFRGYTVKTNPAPGRWRVDIETVDGRLIGRVVFKVMRGSPDGATQTKIVR